LSFAEREEIALLRAQDVEVREIARRLRRSPSTISRELRRNAATRGGRLRYRAGIAQWKAELIARRPKTAKLAENDRLRNYVQDRLAGAIRRPDGMPASGPVTPKWKGRNKPRRQDRRWATAWRPAQIAHRLPIDFPEDAAMRISHDAIYRPFTSKAAARSTASWSPACAPAGRFGSPAGPRQSRQTSS
jgi:IS30 family transposase